jgi:ATP adenylyltransferase
MADICSEGGVSVENIWAPWRIDYIENSKPQGCIFCHTDDDHGRERLILHRTELSLVMLNRYPYTNGHLLVAPLRHTADLDTLSPGEMLDLFDVLRLCRRALQQAASPQGYNLGMNLGKAAGAGVEDHLHFHLVPRWNGDTNFMTVVGDLRVMPENLITTYDKLLPFFTSHA